AAYAHQDLPFEQLVEELRPVRDPSYTPLFQVLFALQNAPLPDVALQGLEAQRMDLETTAAKIDLDLALEETPGGLAGVLDYSLDLFDATTIERMVQHFTLLLEWIVANPEQRIFDLALLSDAERTLMLDTWNDTQMPYSTDRCMHQLFEAQSERTPDVTAVEYNGRALTYAELNARSNQLAHYLRAHGVGAEVRVGVCVERSLEMVIAFLGILKAGGVYVPLDPAYPEDRLQWMLADSQTPLLLTQAQLLGGRQSWQTDQQIRYVCLDRDWPTIAAEATTNPALTITPDNLAYIIYTSGSTGRPKGVMQSHRGLVSLQEVQIGLIGLQVGSRLLQIASASFDASIWELAFPLLSGATLCLADRHDLLPGPNLNRLLREQAITNALLLPSTLAILPTDNLPLLKTIDTGAEKVTTEIVARWSEGRRVINGYGPTETTIYSTVHVCDPASPHDPPIGKPVGNTQIYLLNQYGHPVPIGVLGEIYIGGIGVSRGYLNRPDLTAERFVPNPFGAPGARIYRTGDLGRYLPDGNILYAGRSDEQVKVRGYRIELGEIENALTAHDEIRTAIVQVRETGAHGAQQIVAYVLPEPNTTPNISSLRTFMAARLPEYMVPNAFVLLDELPFTPNGKIDYRALPQPDGARPNLAAAYVAPRTELEQTIAGIWQELLDVDQVGLHDNFFDLGGHSLLVIQLHGKLNEHLGATAAMLDRVSMVDLFKYPTISALSEYLSQSETDRSAPAQQEPKHKAAKEGRNWLKQRLGQPQRTDKKD
ncbi:MAG TPA: amino acid adenylation domain-containing protein, partial [Herpetosiphonaceae bacterium]